jgi:hypothetical protein
VDTVEEAVDLNWTPYFWDNETVYVGPICTECFPKFFQIDEHTEPELQPGLDRLTVAPYAIKEAPYANAQS